MAKKTFLELTVSTNPETSIRKLASSYFHGSQLSLQLLKGDGSDRKVFLISREEVPSKKVIGIYHEDLQENSDFIFISGKMKEVGIPVPEIYHVGENQKTYLLQYLGKYNLGQRIDDWLEQSEPQKIIEAYQCVLPHLVNIQNRLTPLMSGFLKKKLMDRDLFADDLDYFESDFIKRFGFTGFFQGSVKKELEKHLLNAIGKLPQNVFVYRDFQSRNFMWYQEKPWFIDYQSAYLGTIYYDLASMLYSSKSGLDDAARDKLLQHYFGIAKLNINFEQFRQEFYLFVLIRRIRSLGAYGFLSMEKNKKDFFDKIKPGLIELDFLLREKEELSVFKQTRGMIKSILEQWPQRAQKLHPENKL